MFVFCLYCMQKPLCFLCFYFGLGRHIPSSPEISWKLDGNVNNQTYTQGQHTDAFSFGKVFFYFALKFYSGLIHTFRLLGFDWTCNSDVFGGASCKEKSLLIQMDHLNKVHFISLHNSAHTIRVVLVTTERSF